MITSALLIAEYFAFESLPFAVRSDAYGAIVAALGAYNALHVIFALVACVYALARSLRLGISAVRTLAARIAALRTGYAAAQGLVTLAIAYWFTPA